MEFIDQSIYEAINNKSKSYSNKDAMLGMFDAIQCLHQIPKYVHRDIKPDNFRIQDGLVRMIDFGLASEYLDKDGKHIPQTEISFCGTPNTGSISALEGKNHSRRDDLESLGYCFMYTVNDSAVPWK